VDASLNMYSYSIIKGYYYSLAMQMHYAKAIIIVIVAVTIESS